MSARNDWRRVLAPFAVWALVACGGRAQSAGPDSAAAQAGAAGLSTGGQSGSGGDATAGTTSGAGPSASNSFDSPDTLAGIGLWMELGSSLPIGDPPQPHDGPALHLVGDSGAGLDFFFHTAFPVEKYFSRVGFWAQSDLPDSALMIAVAGPEPSYFKDRALGSPWPARVVNLSSDWQSVDVPFSSLGIDKAHPGVHEGPFGAVHFIIEPNTHYDFWIDDFELRSGG